MEEPPPTPSLVQPLTAGDVDERRVGMQREMGLTGPAHGTASQPAELAKGREMEREGGAREGCPITSPVSPQRTEHAAFSVRHVFYAVHSTCRIQYSVFIQSAGSPC